MDYATFLRARADDNLANSRKIDELAAASSAADPDGGGTLALFSARLTAEAVAIREIVSYADECDDPAVIEQHVLGPLASIFRSHPDHPLNHG